MLEGSCVTRLISMRYGILRPPVSQFPREYDPSRRRFSELSGVETGWSIPFSHMIMWSTFLESPETVCKMSLYNLLSRHMNERILPCQYTSPSLRHLACDQLRQQPFACVFSVDVMIPDTNDRFPYTIERNPQGIVPFTFSSAANVAMAFAISMASFTG